MVVDGCGKVGFLRYLVLPKQINDSSVGNCFILTDDYTAAEVDSKQLHSDVRADFNDDIRKHWHGAFAYAYPFDELTGVDSRVCIRIRL